MPQPKMPVLIPVHDQEFQSTTVRLDGKAFERCIFRSCIIEFGATAPISLAATLQFHDCQWKLVEDAKRTIDVLAALRRVPGMEDMVEQVIAHIRGQGLSAQHPDLSA